MGGADEHRRRSTRGRCAADDTERPDELRIDLDPQPGTGFAEAVRAAHALRELLAELGLDRLGQDLGQPRRARLRPDPARRTSSSTSATPSSAIARELERRMPEQVTTAWWKEERGEQVFVDFNQAQPRPHDRARRTARGRCPARRCRCRSAGTTLDAVSPRDFTMRTVPDLLARHGDALGRHGRRRRRRRRRRWPCGTPDVHERGLGEMPFPPDYPKMPGEPPRVQPSRAKRPTSENTP